MKSFVQSHPKHEFFISQAIAGKTISHLLYALFSNTVTVVLYGESDVEYTGVFSVLKAEDVKFSE